jgi:hypothetical protein
MPNRIIKESICTSDEIDQLKPEEEIFFYRLIVNCDDFGRMDARTSILRAKCFPLKLDKVKDKDIETWLRKLLELQLIILYEVDSKPYLQMATWEKHQQIRAKRSKFPSIDEGMISNDINCNQKIANVPVIQSNPIQSESNPNPNTYSKVKYAEYVSMLEKEFNKLVEQYGEQDTKRMIEVLDNYKGSKGKKYKDDYRAILSWVVEKVLSERGPVNGTDNKPTRKFDIDLSKGMYNPDL